MLNVIGLAADRRQTGPDLIMAVALRGAHMPFAYTVETTQAETRIRPSGEVDLAVADQLSAAIVAALTDGPPRVVVDLTDVWFLDSSGIRALLVAHMFATEHQQTMTVENPTRRVRRTLEIGGVLERLTGESR